MNKYFKKYMDKIHWVKGFICWKLITFENAVFEALFIIIIIILL